MAFGEKFSGGKVFEYFFPAAQPYSTAEKFLRRRDWGPFVDLETARPFLRNLYLRFTNF